MKILLQLTEMKILRTATVVNQPRKPLFYVVFPCCELLKLSTLFFVYSTNSGPHRKTRPEAFIHFATSDTIQDVSSNSQGMFQPGLETVKIINCNHNKNFS